MPYLGVKPADEFTSKDLNGEELILDADADTTITADTDDTIDIKIAGADDFKITANTLTALSGSTIATNTIAETTGASGVTIDGLLIKDSTAAFADGAVGTPSITNTGDLNTGVYFPAADTVGMVAGGTEQFRFGSNLIPGGEKNLVQNGSMAVAQRATQTGLGASTAYTQVDRWKLFCSGTAGRVTADQAVGPSGTGAVYSHANALKVDVTTADASVASGDIMSIKHIIEAQNCLSLRYGDSTAQAVTVSFWMKSPKTGTHCVSLYQSDTGRGYIKEFTIASANTWEQFKITFPGDTGGAGINNDTGSGLNIDWPLICGTGEQGSADSWLASGKTATSNQQNLLDSTSNDIYLTGVQLEIGSVGTDFAHEDYGTTLFKCKRYYQRITFGANGQVVGAGENESTTQVAYVLNNKVAQRSEPTFGYSSLAHFSHVSGTSLDTPNNLLEMGGGTGDETDGVNSIISTGNSLQTAGSGYILVSLTAGSYLEYSAEL